MSKIIEGKKMIQYAILLRALAAIIITNSHYTNVYPLEIIASGGLLGDVIFFALSGFVSINVKDKFSWWYLKRIIRIYPSIWIITIFYLMIGAYDLDSWSVLEIFIYPTNYHFIASIMVIYIPYYFIIKNNKFNNNIPLIMGIVFLIQLCVYFFYYDTTIYQIDNVREPMIRFLFFQSMLLGAYFRLNHIKYKDKLYIRDWVILVTMLVLYFVSKIIFTRFTSISDFQIINQIVLFITLVYIMRGFAGIESKIEKLPKSIKKISKNISALTLQIYAVQYPIIPALSNIVFPLNWILITTLIFVGAWILNHISKSISNYILKTVKII